MPLPGPGSTWNRATRTCNRSASWLRLVALFSTLLLECDIAVAAWLTPLMSRAISPPTAELWATLALTSWIPWAAWLTFSEIYFSLFKQEGKSNPLNTLS